ncbi:flagellar hook-length control protein FliK [Desulfopila sp. IMCC35008]|uniref:flagellar hook-length control protein FliK n=1 Tax=Desulfopila sp. IMCC35008 TaxID=2653858 RepID=UPI0013D3D1C6|nr:flagellar hook-length control protein FliK [Desulfopila sp. IMCC35008]
MANIAPIIAPTQAPATPSTSPSPANGSDSSFESILNKTTAAQQQNDPATKNPTNNQPERDPQDAPGTQETDPVAPTTAANPDTPATQPDTPATQNTTTRFADLQKAIEQQAFTKIVLSGTAGIEKQGEQVAIPATLLQQSTLPTGTNSGQSLLTAELEQLITLNEKGVITITRQDGSQVSMADLQNLKGSLADVENLPSKAGTDANAMLNNKEVAAPLRQTSIEQQANVVRLVEDPIIKGGLAKVVVVEDEVATVARNNDNQTTHLRQDSKGQYLEARIGANSQANSGSANNSSQQGTQQDLSGNSLTQGAPQASQITAATETTQSYSQVSQGVLDTPVAKATAGTHPVSPFPGSAVSDDAIVQQVANRFNLQVRNQETQINIRLQPAELGELKIDLTYREGAIRANVFAQSQHVQEILEKNMPKLREILQGQGIQIEDIQVSAKSDIAGDFDLLQDQSGKRNSFEKSHHNSRFDTETFIDVLESASVQGQEDQSGVNVTV